MEQNRSSAIAAFAVVTAAALLFVAAVTRALDLEAEFATELPAAAVTPPMPPDAGPADAPRTPSEATLSAQDIALAVDHDPFQPDRSRPAPYRLPGENLPAEETGPGLSAAPEFVMTGVIQMGDGGLALIQLPNETPRVLGVGESLLGYRLERVGATSATMVGADRTLELALATAPAQPSAQGRNRNTQAGNAAQAGAEMLRALQLRGGALAQQIQDMQRGGASQQQIQAFIQDQLQRATSGGRGAVMRFRRDTTDVPMRTPNDR